MLQSGHQPIAKKKWFEIETHNVALLNDLALNRALKVNGNDVEHVHEEKLGRLKGY